ncbi:MAG: TIGR01906 family membrane protein [Anaerolineales bacterium]|nr:TIGR01906 family membrane protein [Anaerolineales bacterium]
MKILQPILAWLVTLLLPVSLVFLAVRLLLTPTFLYIEYSLPGFPPDEYGFTTEDRLQIAPLALEYLLNDSGITFLGDLEFPDGGELFNQRELSHMLDVKNVVKPVLLVGHLVWGVVAGLGLWAFFGGWWPGYVGAVRRGGWLTVGLVAVLALAAAVSFWQFFTFFHSLFFEGDSWLFLYSDTLIRLFPLRFWRDAFLAVGLTSLGSGLALGLWLRPPKEE